MPAGVNNNFIPLNERSNRVQTEIQEKGREANKIKWTQKKLFEAAVNQKVTQEELIEKLKQQGFTDEQRIVNLLIVLKTVQLAVAGDPDAGRVIREMTGECPHLKLKQEETAMKKRESKAKVELMKKQREDNGEENNSVIINVDI